MPYVTNEGVKLYYEVHGEGEQTLLFAHGMGGNAAVWFNQIAHFAPNYRVIAFDHRYFGRSACSVDDFKPASFAADAIAIMDAEGVASAIWVCQSMGGWTGSQLAVHYSDRVDALIMSHTPGIFEHATAVNDTSRLARTIESGVLPALASDFPEKNPTMAALYGAINRFNTIENAAVSRKIGQARLGVDIESLADYSTPTLFITADQDVLFDSGYIEALALALPGAQFTNLGDVGHSSYFELPIAFNATVDGFLNVL
ncbi:MAG: 3-oxoadipate enol-lactonase [Candidatus Azotimanducaceae bacterium]|jgi:3-oxoadipate enol-lactonase